MAAMGKVGLKTVQGLSSREDMMNGTRVLAVGIVGSGLLECVLEVKNAKKNHTLLRRQQ